MLSTIIVWVLDSPIATALMKILWNNVSGYFEGLLAKHKAILANQTQAMNSVIPLEKATTGDQIEAASDSALDKL